MKMYHVHCDLEYIVKKSLNFKCLEFLMEKYPLINEDSEAVFILFAGDLFILLWLNLLVIVDINCQDSGVTGVRWRLGRGGL